jgi:hypothetical protein
MRNAYDTTELALVRSALARALHADPPDLAALSAALGHVDKILAAGAPQPSAATALQAARPALPVARGFFAG